AKGALNVYLQGVRSRLHGAGVKVTTLKLGPVDTPMTRDHQKTRLFATAAGVARGIVAALDAGTPEAYVPAFWAAIMPIVKHPPDRAGPGPLARPPGPAGRRPTRGPSPTAARRRTPAPPAPRRARST